MSKLIHTSAGALDGHFQRLASGRYRRRLRCRAPRQTPGGSAPLKAA